MTRGTRKRPASTAIGRIGEHLIERRQGRGSSSLGRLIDVDMSRCRYSTRVETLHLLGICHDVSELAREELLFVCGQFELCERGNPLDVRDGKGREA